MPTQAAISQHTKFIPRLMASAIMEANRYFPVITVTGPRQSGKSTLLRHLFSHLPYFSLEDPDTRLTVKDDPKGFLLSHKEGVILDEVQNYPDILSYIQTFVDLNPQSKFYLTGSSNFSLLKSGSQSHLLDIDSASLMARDKMRGHLFENMVVMEFLKQNYNRGKSSSLYFYRDSNGAEVDLMVKRGSAYDCYEIKSAQTFHPDFTKGLKSFAKAFPDLTGKQSVIYAGTSLGILNDIEILNYRNLS